jgi:hypothetical protein
MAMVRRSLPLAQAQAPQSIRSNASMRAMPLSKEMAINLQSFGGDEAQ